MPLLRISPKGGSEAGSESLLADRSLLLHPLDLVGGWLPPPLHLRGLSAKLPGSRHLSY
jgi:hypothetical protein